MFIYGVWLPEVLVAWIAFSGFAVFFAVIKETNSSDFSWKRFFLDIVFELSMIFIILLVVFFGSHVFNL